MTTYKALQDGVKTTARKVNGHWLIGGNNEKKRGAVSILMEKDGQHAWFRLKGCFLVFEDVAMPSELDGWEI